jgi:hypothetical protein
MFWNGSEQFGSIRGTRIDLDDFFTNQASF